MKEQPEEPENDMWSQSWIPRGLNQPWREYLTAKMKYRVIVWRIQRIIHHCSNLFVNI